MVATVCQTVLLLSPGSSSQSVCSGEDHRQRQYLATRHLLRHRLSQGFSPSPDQHAAQPGPDLLLHTAPYWQQSIPGPHGKIHQLQSNLQLFISLKIKDVSSSLLLQIQFSPLRQYSYVSVPNSKKIDSKCFTNQNWVHRRTSDRQVFTDCFKIVPTVGLCVLFLFFIFYFS